MAESDFEKLSEAMAQAAAKAGSSTVQVRGRQRMPASGISFAADLVLTADHVLERDEDLHVALPDGRDVPASLAGRDPGSDLAVLRLSQALATPAEAAKAEPRIGQLVLALGRPSLDGIEASLGVVSAIGGPARTGRGGVLERYLRTDTTPYPGFSGGPLVDAAGAVLGVNTSGLGRGAAITIPTRVAWGIAETLAAHGHLKRGFLGVRSQPVAITPAQQQALGREQEAGLLLVSVESGSPAEKGGLIVGDILVAIDGKPVSDGDDLLVTLSATEPGKATPIQVLRAGAPVTLSVVVGER